MESNRDTLLETLHNKDFEIEQNWDAKLRGVHGDYRAQVWRERGEREGRERGERGEREGRERGERGERGEREGRDGREGRGGRGGAGGEGERGLDEYNDGFIL